VPVGRPTTLENQLASKMKDSLNLHNLVDRVVAAVSGNEGNFTAISMNDASDGLSVGIRQWNQKAGELPTLLNEGWIRNADLSAQPGLMDDPEAALADRQFHGVQVSWRGSSWSRVSTWA